MDIEITCNTDDEELFRNIRDNTSSLSWKWVKLLPEHDGHACIVGGGPSLKDKLPILKKRIALGQTVFALNGAAKFLNSHEIIPDYQVILDARPKTVAVRGDAKEYLIASQCHPCVFDRLDNVTMWHPAIEGITFHLPEYDDDYALVGGGTSSGLSAMCLAYTLGYRKLHLFGYDSSHSEGRGHAYEQRINDDEPTCRVTVHGNKYLSTLTMARQAELFPECANNLIDLGCIITVDSDGLIMEAVKAMRPKPPIDSEAEKYRQVWEHSAYRNVSPGERDYQEFLDVADVSASTRLIEFGCGTGRGGAAIADATGCSVTQVDIAENCRDEGMDFPFFVADISMPMPFKGDIGYCTDVMEHLPPEQVRDAIGNIMSCVDLCFFKIAMFPDRFGGVVGHPLHLSVFQPEWWEEKFSSFHILHKAVGSGPLSYLTLYVKKTSSQERN